MSDRQAADSARALWPGLKVLVSADYAEAAAGSWRDLNSGMPALTKPFALDDLANRMHDLIETWTD